ncbi:glycoside hydrolase domain-containing protein [Nocardia sp. CNY236]|uniref:glycoside hydrolase domain-containing protein n=1 Tax=Nocardia sp. CNY236 TaxID=1169152 RepID=UPI000411BEF6|nr:glycoside hydrolase domain-containing protein [Nocardia sp. CNY236]
MAELIDFSAALIEPQAIKDAGYVGVVGYFSDSRPGTNFGAKPLTREYCDRLRAVGLEIVTNYQYGKGDTADWKGGYDAGVHHAQIALGYHFAAGGPGFRPLYASVDSNPSLHEWNSLIVPFLRGWASVVGLEWTGMYGNARCIDWALEDGVATWFWQHNWSGDPSINDDHPAAHIHQIRIDRDRVGGVVVDVNTILADDYGQWSKATPPAPGPGDEVNRPEYVELDRMGNSASSRHGARVVNFLLHTQEGNGTAESLANYLNNPRNGVSYHYTLHDRVVVNVVDTDLASWSVLDANPYTINLCFAGSRAAWSRNDWLLIRDDIRIAAWFAVQDARKYDFEPHVIVPPYERREGISDHRYVTDCLGIGTHTDVGPNFPWDVFVADVHEFAGSGPRQPVPNAIDDSAAANPWLGSRITDGELGVPDGIGRRAHFEHGHIYWHPDTGAHAIPEALWATYAELGWETGPLGYPVTERTVLDGPDGRPWGVVQGFQGGALYRRLSSERAYRVHGAIRDRWNRTGFESGPLGWPESDELPWDGGAYQDFEHGRVYWTPDQTLAMISVGGVDIPLGDGEG